jgi:hypothetical protein
VALAVSLTALVGEEGSTTVGEDTAVYEITPVAVPCGRDVLDASQSLANFAGVYHRLLARIEREQPSCTELEISTRPVRPPPRSRWAVARCGTHNPRWSSTTAPATAPFSAPWICGERSPGLRSATKLGSSIPQNVTHLRPRKHSDLQGFYNLTTGFEPAIFIGETGSSRLQGQGIRGHLGCLLPTCSRNRP